MRDRIYNALQRVDGRCFENIPYAMTNPVRVSVRWHLASVKSLCPFGQPEKALGHEPQIDPWLPHRTTTRLASFRTRSASSLLMKMHLLRWINPRHNTPRASSIANGLDVANQTRASRRREKNVLDMPSYRSGHCTQNPLPRHSE